MTREEAIKEFESELKWAELNIYPYVSKQKIEADNMAIKALGQESCEDCVSRIEALNSLDKVENKDSWYRLTDVMKMIRNLPPVTPQPKTGHWTNGDPICPCCGEDKFKDLDADIWSDWQPKYCPNCGAKMEEVTE